MKIEVDQQGALALKQLRHWALQHAGEEALMIAVATMNATKVEPAKKPEDKPDG